jgi:type I site-specific restriction endonuclease
LNVRCSVVNGYEKWIDEQSTRPKTKYQMMAETNQTPEQIARDQIDWSLEQAGWIVQSSKKIDFSAGRGIAVKEYQTDIGPADYALFIDKKAVGVIEAKPKEWGQKITTVEEQSDDLAEEIIENLEAGLNSFREVLAGRMMSLRQMERAANL